MILVQKGEKEIKNVIELIVCRAAKNEERRQSRLRGLAIAMRLRQPEHFASPQPRWRAFDPIDTRPQTLLQALI